MGIRSSMPEERTKRSPHRTPVLFGRVVGVVGSVRYSARTPTGPPSRVVVVVVVAAMRRML
jgi:hypothetical protein